MTPHNRETLLALADRAEKATGPDHALDWDISEATGAWQKWPTFKAFSPTEDLNAAVSLAPDGVRRLLNIAEDGITTAIVDGTQGVGNTPALALCAAALRARATLEPGEKA